MRVLSYGQPPEPRSPSKEVVDGAQSEQPPARRVLTESTARQTSKRKSAAGKGSRRGKEKAQEAAGSQSFPSTTGLVTIGELENFAGPSRLDIAAQQEDTGMDLVTSTSTGSLGMDQAMQAMEGTSADTTNKVKRRKRLRKVAIHVEVALKPSSAARTGRAEVIKQAVHDFLNDDFDSLLPDSTIVDWDDIPLLEQYVATIRVAECSIVDEAIRLEHANLHIHVYRPSRQFIIDSFSASAENEDEDQEGSGEDSDVLAATIAHLPSLALEGVWDNLIYEDDVKLRLLSYIESTQAFSERMVDFNVITWNRLVLLHGPPGTGKTTLCRALAQKLVIRLSEHYVHGKLVEINSHSIMSKWFSESGKLVQRLFTKVLDLVDDETSFVVVLIDEVESLTAARSSAMGGKEPGDAVRVVNALLTQLDKLKHRKNVLIMTTSNLSSAIDSAFIDRADIKQYIGLPPVQAVYWILLGCLHELMRSGVVRSSPMLDWKRLKLHLGGFEDESVSKRTLANSTRLMRIAERCHGMSGRTLRRLPLLAHSRSASMVCNGDHRLGGAGDEEHSDYYSEEDQDESGSCETRSESVETWLAAMEATVEAERVQAQHVEGGDA